MVETLSTMQLPLGSKAPAFDLPDIDGNKISLTSFTDAKAMVVMFICNHCPFVKHVQGQIAQLAKDYRAKGVAFVGINANDWQQYPDDSPERMRQVAKQADYTFPYCYDASQAVAKLYRAACTPDFFLFDGQRMLVYRGQLDDSRPGNNVPVTGKDLRAAIEAVLAGRPVPGKQKPSIGCNIKWKPGNEPEYFQS